MHHTQQSKFHVCVNLHGNKPVSYSNCFTYYKYLIHTVDSAMVQPGILLYNRIEPVPSWHTEPHFTLIINITIEVMMLYQTLHTVWQWHRFETVAMATEVLLGYRRSIYAPRESNQGCVQLCQRRRWVKQKIQRDFTLDGRRTKKELVGQPS